MRVALYGRHSDDKQNPRSSGDQLDALQRAVDARGWTTVARYVDEAISGETIAARPGVQALLAAAKTGAFDLVFAEDLSRLARDQEWSAHIRKRLGFAGVLLETLIQGRISGSNGIIQSAFAGAFGEVFLDDLADKTRRGLESRVRAGFSGGGLCYGYDLVPGETGRLAINEGQAQVVRRIFADYAAGRPPRAIAIALNAQGVAGPRGGAWSPSSVAGDRRAGDGVLCQELYVGVRVFNRRRYRKDPDTGRRSGVLNPPEAWIREPVPALRIVTDAAWAAVQARQQALAERPAAFARRPRRLLSGLIFCGLCAGPMTLYGARYQCAHHRDRGTCGNRKCIGAAAIEARVIEGVRARMLAPEAMARAARDWQADHEAARRRAVSERAPMERELAEVGRRIDRLLETYLAGEIERPEMTRAMEPLKARRAALEGALAAADAPAVVRMHPGAAAAYAALAQDLAQTLAADDAGEVRDAFRALIERVDFHPLEGHGQFGLTVHGSLARLLQVGEAGGKSGAPKRENPTARGDCGVSLGAGARFGQSTTGQVSRTGLGLPFDSRSAVTCPPRWSFAA